MLWDKRELYHILHANIKNALDLSKKQHVGLSSRKSLERVPSSGIIIESRVLYGSSELQIYEREVYLLRLFPYQTSYVVTISTI